VFWILSLLELLVFYAFGGFADNLSIYLFAEFLFSGALLIYFLATNRHRFFEDYLCTIVLLLSLAISFVEVGLSMFYGETADIAPLNEYYYPGIYFIKRVSREDPSVVYMTMVRVLPHVFYEWASMIVFFALYLRNKRRVKKEGKI